MIVDGVEYDTAAVRRLVHERHQLASEMRRLVRELEADREYWKEGFERDQGLIQQLRDRLDRADVHLRLRTAALHRVIARKGPHFD